MPIGRGVQWLDLAAPSAEEREAVEQATHVRLPARGDISGLGLAHRRHHDPAVLSLHLQMYADPGHGAATPLALLVTRHALVTLRYAPVQALSAALSHPPRDEDGAPGPALLAQWLESVTNEIASHMQAIASDVAALSDTVFSGRRDATRALRGYLQQIGLLEGRLARYRTTMLGLSRMTGYVDRRAPDWFGEPASARVRVVFNDLATLDEFDDQLTSKLQFLQDAVLGFISTDQNAVMKLLTVASVITVPPMLLAGIWGMNFRHMPELGLRWGYPLALAAMGLSLVVPLAWFGARGWLSRD